MKPAVSGLEQEFPGRIRTQNLDASAPEAREVIRAAGFENHGLIIQGSGQVTLWKQADHEVRIEDVRAALEKLVSGS